MRLRNIPGARQELAGDRFVVPEDLQPKLRGRWAEAFAADLSHTEPEAFVTGTPEQAVKLPDEDQNAPVKPEMVFAGHPDTSSISASDFCQAASPRTRRPLHIEIGMGKGKFLTELALRNPDINYAGIEKYSSVLVRAVRRRENLEAAGKILDNLLYLRMDAEKICDIFGPGEADRIYLNFSDPWPKDRHAKRRLPGRTFLARYEKILAPGGHVEFKTDNRPLFDFAVEEAKAAGWMIDACTYDLHADPVLNKDNIMTEYEERFSAMGNPICKLISRPNLSDN